VSPAAPSDARPAPGLAAAWLALAFGLFLALAETARNWGRWQWWPFWLVDFVAAALLVAGAVLVLRRARGGHPLLCGAWGFATAMFYMSFWSHVAEQGEAAEGNLAQGPLTVVIGILWAVTVVGFGLALLSGRRSAGQAADSKSRPTRSEPKASEGGPPPG
jgi:hypothetical protein